MKTFAIRSGGHSGLAFEHSAEVLRILEADVIRVQPPEKGLNYAANNYAIGSAQIQGSATTPAVRRLIRRLTLSMPIWRTMTVLSVLRFGGANMVTPLQTFLFQHGKEMAGKKIGLIVSSASSGISSVESDAKRLISDGDFLTPSLWIRSSQTAGCHSLITGWLKNINYCEPN